MQKEVKRRIFLWVKIIVLILIVAYAAFFITTYRKIQNGELVKFQGHWYTPEQLSQILPPQYAPLKEPINTTEEVYTKFREALLSGEIDVALGYIRERDREYYIEAFNDLERIKNYTELPLYSQLEIYDDMENFQKGYYYYKEGDKEPFSINFKLNQRTALWEIDSI
ncbi:MAG: hypothetical protein PF572_04685 [Patescibacteria group bacterium]|jgi:hypothetical protein|nr:hypothetical protein [Patescibacteria group bacterium]